MVFAFADADLDFNMVPFPVGAQDGEGEALLLRLGQQLHDLVLVQQQAPGAAGLVRGVAGLLVGLNVTAIEPDLAAIHASESVGDVELPEAVFGQEVRKDLLHTVVRWQLACRRQGTAMTKTKGLVSGGGKKPFKQKGTGGARQG